MKKFISKFILQKSINDYRGSYKKRKSDKKKLAERELLTQTYFTEGRTESKLHIGCGHNVLDGWLNTDLLNNSKVAYLDAADTYPFDENTFSFIFNEHLFEHLNFHQQIKFLEECFRVLKHNGVLRIATPSADFIQNLLANKTPEYQHYAEWSVNNLSALSEIRNIVKTKEVYPVYVVNNFYRDWGHQQIHNLNSLKNLLEIKGFTNIKECHVGQSSHAELTSIEHHMNMIPDSMNQLETMIIEASKP